ncbi:MAG TPA: UDP-glucose/GDP-mannose dehydrogenase family protein [Bacteroidales bacterium]|jgi:UDPglucose 6-dehydrogenase|nr:UDP-glucose/GDP-mannose dehydrogenase family protein [Bacteroidales bacterium]
MNISIAGTGYVGLVSGACFAELGATVRCIDTDQAKIAGLNNGIMPIYEPGLADLVHRNMKAGRLSFSTDLAGSLGDTEILFIAVGTPPAEDGSADLSHVLAVARTIGENLEKYLLVVTKSTVPVGSSELVRETIAGELKRRGKAIGFDIASNPEFLKEGAAIEDFMKPDRVVVGTDSGRARELMTRLYAPMQLSSFRVIFMDIASAEMTKYAANAMLATRISFINEIANLCEKVGADVSLVRKGIGSDTRIGSKFLYPGPGFGGSCFPKDVKALIKTGRDHGSPVTLLESVEAINERQKRVLFGKFSDYYRGDLRGRRAAIWGLSYKPGTDDMREAPSLTLISQLLQSGCTVRVHDPVAMDEARRRLGPAIEYAADIYDSVTGADVLFHVTEWKEYRMPDWQKIGSLMKHPLLIDGRGVFDRAGLPGMVYLRIG